MLQSRASIGERGEDGVCWTTNAVQLGSAPITGSCLCDEMDLHSAGSAPLTVYVHKQILLGVAHDPVVL